MRRSLLLALALLAAPAGCTTSSPGHGEGAGVPVSSGGSSGVSTSASATRSAPSTNAAPSSQPATSSASRSSASSSAPPAGRGVGSYTGRGGPNTWCGSSQLAVTYTSGGAGMGHSAVILRFLNNSHYPCVLYGYPGVDGTNRSGHSTGHAARTTDGYLGGCGCSQPRGVRVRPGQLASALVEGDARHDGCAGRYRGLLVTPPNTFDSTPIPTAPEGCDLQVHPVVASSNGRG